MPGFLNCLSCTQHGQLTSSARPLRFSPSHRESLTLGLYAVIRGILKKIGHCNQGLMFCIKCIPNLISFSNQIDVYNLPQWLAATYILLTYYNNTLIENLSPEGEI